MGLICAYGKALKEDSVKGEKNISIGKMRAEKQAVESFLDMTCIYVTVSWEQHVMTYIYIYIYVIRRERVKVGCIQ